jgi:hypothetical protein
LDEKLGGIVSTQRYISTSFWDDEWIQSLNLAEKAIYLYLLTNPLTNIAGIYKITDRRIVFDTGLEPMQLTSIMLKFQEAGKASRFNEYIIIPSWPKHQKWKSNIKIKAGIETILKSLPSELISFLKNIGYTYPIDTLSISNIYPSNYNDGDSNTDSDINSDCDSTSCDLSKTIDKQPPLFIQKIQDEGEKLGIILDKKLATKAATSGIDPTWFEGSFSFPVFVNEWLKENPKYRDKTAHEMTLLFASAFSWENLRKEYPLWKQGKKHELDEKEKLKAIEAAKKNHPVKCECGENLHEYCGEFWCNKCSKVYTFDEKTLKWKGSG